MLKSIYISYTENNDVANLAANTCGFAGLDFSTAVISFIAAVIGLIIVIKGVALINELRLRGLDSVCGFHAMLKANLLLLRSAAGIVEESNNIKCEEKISIKAEDVETIEAGGSVFMWFACETPITEIKAKADEYKAPLFKEEDKKIFMSHAASTIELFKHSNGQIPLGKQLYDDLNELLITLIDISEAEKGNKSIALNPLAEAGHKGSLDTTSSVYIKAEQFNLITKRILNEIDLLTIEMLKKLWKRYDKDKAKLQNRFRVKRQI